MAPRLLAPLVAGLLAFGLLTPALAQTAQELDLAIRDTRLAENGESELLVNVTGASSQVLDSGSFRVAEQQEEVTDLEVEPLLGSTDEQVIAWLVLDVSDSMEGEPLDSMKEAAAQSAAALVDEGVLVGVIEFHTDATILVDPTLDTAAVTSAIGELEALDRTALYDAIVLATEEAERSDAISNIVVFADGEDNESEVDITTAIAAANAAEVPLTMVVLEAALPDSSVLEPLATETGGRTLLVDDLDGIGATFAEVTADLASQYLLSYRATRSEPDTLQLQVSVTDDDREASREFAVVNPRRPGLDIEGPRAVAEGAPGWLGNPIALYGAVFAAFVALALLLLLLFSGVRTTAGRNLETQLSRYLEGDDRAGRSSVVSAYFRDRATEFLETAPRPRGFDSGLERRLEQAAWPIRTSEFLALIIASGVVVGLLVGVATNALGGVLLGIIAASVPLLIMEQRRSKRRASFLRQLPDTLQLMAGSLRAGYGTMQAIDSVAKEASPPTSEEFARVLTEARLGMPLEDALGMMAERIDNADFRWVVMAINIQREVGGNLAELLDTVAEVLREREMLRRQISVLSAEGRLSALILIGLPIVLTIYLILVRPEYIGVLVTSGPIGFLLIGGAILLMLIGVIWIRNLIRIEV